VRCGLCVCYDLCYLGGGGVQMGDYRWGSWGRCCTSYAVVLHIVLLMMGILMPETC
jgi:hypothetical protein